MLPRWAALRLWLLAKKIKNIRTIVDKPVDRRGGPVILETDRQTNLLLKGQKMFNFPTVTIVEAKEITAAATLEQAREWQAETDKWVYAADMLGISAEQPNSEKLVGRLEARFEKLLKQADTKLYVTITYATHTYTATVTRVGQLEAYLAKAEQPFHIGNMAGDYPANLEGFRQELNRISRFGLSQNVTATCR